MVSHILQRLAFLKIKEEYILEHWIHVLDIKLISISTITWNGPFFHIAILIISSHEDLEWVFIGTLLVQWVGGQGGLCQLSMFLVSYSPPHWSFYTHSYFPLYISPLDHCYPPLHLSVHLNIQLSTCLQFSSKDRDIYASSSYSFYIVGWHY